MTLKQVEAHTDGACLGNPGPGGWAALLRFRGKEREVSGGEVMTTNNRMELMAAIMALETMSEACQVVLFTRSVNVPSTVATARTWPAALNGATRATAIVTRNA